MLPEVLPESLPVLPIFLPVLPDALPLAMPARYTGHAALPFLPRAVLPLVGEHVAPPNLAGWRTTRSSFLPLSALVPFGMCESFRGDTWGNGTIRQRHDDVGLSKQARRYAVGRAQIVL